MVEPKVCLVVCFYKGTRDGGQELLYNEYLTTHKKMLKKLKHNLRSIVFVVAQDGRETIEIVKEDNITYFYRPNKGLSFGGWADVCSLFGEKYDYYIFCEDDYFFVKDNFDTILVDEYKLCNKQYMVTFRAKKVKSVNYYRGEMISTVGIISSKVLSDIDYFKHYLSITPNKGRSIIEFFKSFSTIGSISENYERFIYFAGHLVKPPLSDLWRRILYNYKLYGDSMVIFDNIPKDSDYELNKKRVLLCCYQALSEYVQLT